jgi:hypothetical protein
MLCGKIANFPAGIAQYLAVNSSSQSVFADGFKSYARGKPVYQIAPFGHKLQIHILQLATRVKGEAVFVFVGFIGYQQR